MADDTDFLDLYRKLRLDADCTLAEFKQAYRRHVSQWHPDRRRGSRADVIAARRLQRLTAQYGAAMEFHKRHGRLPGAAATPRGQPVAAPQAITMHLPALPEASMPSGSTASGHVDTRWLIVGGAVAIGLLAWFMLPGAAPQEAAAWRPGTARAAGAPVATAAALAAGMRADEVIAVEGEPTRRGEDHWEYGPSWIRFDGGAVSDWYSSPLRPLHATAPRAQR